jgi:hypothetical protein
MQGLPWRRRCAPCRDDQEFGRDQDTRGDAPSRFSMPDHDQDAQAEGDALMAATPFMTAPPVRPDIEQALTFCSALFNPGDVIHFRATPDKKGTTQHSTNHHYAFDKDFPENLHGFLQYCDIEERAPFVLPGPVRTNGTHAADVLSLSAILVDFDKGDPAFEPCCD